MTLIDFRVVDRACASGPTPSAKAERRVTY
jgi:hypothetical protein